MRRGVRSPLRLARSWLSLGWLGRSCFGLGWLVVIFITSATLVVARFIILIIFILVILIIVILIIPLIVPLFIVLIVVIIATPLGIALVVVVMSVVLRGWVNLRYHQWRRRSQSGILGIMAGSVGAPIFGITTDQTIPNGNITMPLDVVFAVTVVLSDS